MLQVVGTNVARIFFAAIFVAICAQGGCAGATSRRGPSIVLSPATDEAQVLTIGTLDGQVLDAFEQLEAGRRQEVVQVWVAAAPAGAPPLGGDVARRNGNLVFTPRYPFQPGLKYRARFDPAVLGAADPPVETEFEIPAPPREPVTRVAAIYPSADVLPENLLKFYIHFSGPMSRGEAYRRIRLLDDAGQPVPAPFLEMDEELWNPEMTRFTLFFEPGRIKQGLVSREEMGPALVSGKTYTLEIDAAWQDGEGRPLVEAGRKTFRAGDADRVQPNPSRWRIAPPGAGSNKDLMISFDESLDHAMLGRVITVRNQARTPVTGKVSISEQERRWSFTPDAPWTAGRHVIAVETILEDNAGNSIGRPFEVNLNQPPQPSGPAQVEIPFDIARH